jgi:RNA polymerase-binding transcription factor DksA
MATKKILVKKGSSKSANAKKASPAKKAGKTVSKKTTQQVMSKKITKSTENIVPKPAATKKVVEVAVKASKPAPAKASKPELAPVAAKKAEAEKADHKKPELKPVEAIAEPVVEAAPPKQPVKKDVAPAKTAKLVMPDIKTKTIRKYEPDFTKSVLDTPTHDQSAPSQRYSDADLSEFRDLINKKLDAAKKELNYLQGLITRKDEMGGDESDNRYMTMEDGSISMEREQLSQMASRQITFIDHLEKAIMRIENKTYGICRITGKLIDKARLRAVPHATLSIEAKQTMNR